MDQYWNAYSYCGADPVNYVDEWGLYTGDGSESNPISDPSYSIDCYGKSPSKSTPHTETGPGSGNNSPNQNGDGSPTIVSSFYKSVHLANDCIDFLLENPWFPEAIMGAYLFAHASIETTLLMPVLVRSRAPIALTWEAAIIAEAGMGTYLMSDALNKAKNSKTNSSSEKPTTRQTKEDVEEASRKRTEQKLGIELENSTNKRVDWVDKNGNTYDQIGNPITAKHWKYQKDNFLEQIITHCKKANFAVVDLTGFPKGIVNEVKSFINTLPQDVKAQIIQIGF